MCIRDSDSAALPDIVAHYARVLESRRRVDEAAVLIRSTLLWLPPAADSSTAVVAALRDELRRARPGERAPAR